jgi:3-hydroxyisobutyrate dehydrogenase
VRLHQKDLNICHDMAKALGVELPVVEATLGDYARLIAAGYGDEDISAIYRLKAALFATAAAS